MQDFKRFLENIKPKLLDSELNAFFLIINENCFEKITIQDYEYYLGVFGLNNNSLNDNSKDLFHKQISDKIK